MEATTRPQCIPYILYEKADYLKTANRSTTVTHSNKSKLLKLLKKHKTLFDGILGDVYYNPVNINIQSGMDTPYHCKRKFLVL